MSNKTIQHLVLSGGGLLGISYVGLFKYFEEHNIISNIKSITGCSAGAIFGSLLAIGYTSDQLDAIIKTMVFKDYLKINVDSILNFINTKGFESGKILNIFIKKCIKDKIGDDNITFAQINDKYNIKLQIGVTNLTQSKFELFNKDTTPDLPIEKAISASIALPFIFEPIVIGEDVYCDGGLLDNLPIENIIDQNLDLDLEPGLDSEQDTDTQTMTDDSLSVIGFYLINKNSQVINKDNYKKISLSHYINIMTHTLSNNFINKKIQDDNNNKNKKKHKIITIEIPCDIMTFIKLNATHDDINNIIHIAYTKTKNELKLE
jgi:predicted acylesterase/phospholipase RssA